ncbi:MAG: hypothetical protein COT81_05250 [Candidatus Buchananbacteria bacterium CG10_big_fil_rev_8_21_14_0_10_42_9]|uniref:Nucleoside 2-deoxyribosyltransferase n=1 Tax=Candidatus Buchananbacteria bacterium CG10_big_fil_rev_8_21_14_0_10_42_9 TaxID=1974526 RepID=A0A2H0VZY8_9BACT|nr:MAG: hypothetical protein COT81_05250 [Candidatus Buchananbacteria bacterium CG10_big_fil_rev_8_21_14_0_10_42_9]
MKFYLATNETVAAKANTDLTRITEALERLGVMVISPLNKSESEYAEMVDTGPDEMVFESIDAIIIESEATGANTGYQIALALTHKKPILYLHQNGTIDPALKPLLKNKTTAKLLKVEKYNAQSLNSILNEFIKFVEIQSGQETPNIKFTLRITSKIEKYLQWKTHNTKLSKADYLRELIDREIDKDDKFKNYLDK